TIASSGDSRFPTCDHALHPCVPISRFYAAGPNSHFYTGYANELADLSQPNTGWVFEGLAFVAPLPDSRFGTCAVGGEVYRLYNGHGESTHRYTPSEDARARMIAAGWIDEGIAFCASRGGIPTASYQVQVDDPAGIMDSSQCDAPVAVARSC